MESCLETTKPNEVYRGQILILNCGHFQGKQKIAVKKNMGSWTLPKNCIVGRRFFYSDFEGNIRETSISYAWKILLFSAACGVTAQCNFQ